MQGPNLAAMAWRNLWRNRRRTIVTLSSMSFGILLAVLFTGLGDATYADMIDLAARMGSGHVTLQHPEALETPSLNRTVKDAPALSAKALEDPGVTRVVTRIRGQALLATAKRSTAAFFVAFDPEAEDEVTMSLLEAVSEGEMFATAQSKGVVLGEGLAVHLGVKLGRKVVYTVTDKHGEIVSGLARVKGIVRTGAASIDRSLCLLPLDAVRETLSYEPGEATQVAVFVRDQRMSEELAGRLAPQVGPEVAALPWSEVQPELAGFISMKMSSTTFMELIIALLVAAGIFNTLFVSVMERLREFGIMMAIGFSPGRLFRLVMWESLWLALVGMVAGVLVTIVPYYLGAVYGLDMSAMVGEGGAEVAGVAMKPIFYIGIYPESAVVIGVAVIAATLLSGLYPAWRAGRVVPVDSIKLV